VKSNLIELAKLYGIQPSYVDMRKKTLEASVDSLLLVLNALDVPVSKSNDVKAALRARKQELAERTIEPVIVAWDGKIRKSSTRFTSQSGVSLLLEDGSELSWPPPSRLPMGYHKIVRDHGGNRYESLVISAPERAHFPVSGRVWGMFAPLYGLHSKRNIGAGTISELESLIDWMDELGGKVAATLPLLPTFLDHPFEPSPYSPISRLFWNEFYLNPERSPEYPIHDSKPRSSTSRSLVDYRREMDRKRRIVEKMSTAFFSQSGRRREQLEQFVNSNPVAPDYARFRAVTEKMAEGWRSWPSRLKQGEIRTGDYREEDFRYHLYSQWLVQDQMQQLSERASRTGCVLYLDLPAGLHADGFDTWRYQNLFVKDMSVGAPPDLMFTSGQNWSFPPMHPEAMRADQYRYLIAVVRNHLRYARMLRIDHVMGLHRLFWIPDGLTGDQGVYVRYPSDEIYSILSIESHRHDAGIVGENLGLVPEAVNRALTRHNIRQLYIVQAELSRGSLKKPLRKPKAESVASLNTHDMAPFQAFINGDDIDDRIDLKFIDRKDAQKEGKSRRRIRKALKEFLSKPDLYQGSVEFLGKSKANVVLVNLEDMWGETNPQNVPATTKQRPNWRRIRKISEDFSKTQQSSKLKNLKHVLIDRKRSLPLQ
jgi:4-alpha-glucanotransferase